MRDEDFRHQRDVYRERCRRGAAERCQYYAWGQTKYTVHLAFWLASEDCEADVDFRQAGEAVDEREAGGGEEGAEGEEVAEVEEVEVFFLAPPPPPTIDALTLFSLPVLGSKVEASKR